MVYVKLDYDSLHLILEKLNELKGKFDTTCSHIVAVKTMLENNNSGEAIDSLIDLCDNAITKINAQQDNVDVSITVLNDYIEDTKFIIKPVNDSSKVEVNAAHLKINFGLIRKVTKKYKEQKMSWN